MGEIQVGEAILSPSGVLRENALTVQQPRERAAETLILGPQNGCHLSS